MVREQGQYIVIPFGYEHTAPMLAQLPYSYEVEQIKQNIKDAPDFLLFSPTAGEIFLVEVRYRHTLDDIELKKMVTALEEKKWQSSYLFVATQNAFFFGSCNEIRATGITAKNEKLVPVERQHEYHNLLRKFL